MKVTRSPGHQVTSKRKGKIFIISAPSGCGKTTLCKMLLDAHIGLTHSVSMTTRRKRIGEKDGRDYYFVSKDEFQKMIRQSKFLEWTKTYGWYYGTPKGFVEGLLKKGRDVLLSIDVKGAMKIRRLYQDSVLVFILPPSINELKDRLTRRNADNEIEIEKRLKIVNGELLYADRYDYQVVNDNLNNAISRLKAIIIAEKCRSEKKEVVG